MPTPAVIKGSDHFFATSGPASSSDGLKTSWKLK